MRRSKTTELLKHTFSATELADRSQILAQSFQRLSAAREEKAAAAAQFSERIKTEEALLGKTSRELTQGWEMRQIDCKIFYNTPNAGMKQYQRSDTEEIVKTLSMDQDEMQSTLFEEPVGPNHAEITENNIRNFFGMKPADPSAPSPSEDPVGWKNGEWIVVATTAESALQWMQEKGHKGMEEGWELADMDTTIIKGLESFFGTDVIPLRRAIVHMQKEGISFPMLLQIPEGYLQRLVAGKDPDKTEPEPPAETPPAAKKPGRKPKAPKDTPKDDIKPSDGEDEEPLEPGE